MMSFRRMLPFLILNILISATTVLAILFWWQGQMTEQVQDVSAVDVAIALAATAPSATATAEAEIAQLTAVAANPPPSEEAGETPDETTNMVNGMEVYTIQAGDTLGRISTLYGVPLEDIITVNNIDNPNVLQVGQEILIPVNGIPTPTPTVTPTAVPNIPPTPIPTASFTQGEVIININEVLAPGDLSNEAISIVNLGSRPVSLEGWQLSDPNGLTFVFPAVTLFGDGAGILLHTKAGQSTALDLYWGLDAPLWQTGDTLTLRDVNGAEQATFTITP
jgi:LysM repeat protein